MRKEIKCCRQEIDEPAHWGFKTREANLSFEIQPALNTQTGLQSSCNAFRKPLYSLLQRPATFPEIRDRVSLSLCKTEDEIPMLIPLISISVFYDTVVGTRPS